MLEELKERNTEEEKREDLLSSLKDSINITVLIIKAEAIKALSFKILLENLS
jgi:hypothetical protein